MYEERTYRNLVKTDDLVTFQVIVKETDLLIRAAKDISREARESVLKYRHQIETYIERNPPFQGSLSPLLDDPHAPGIIREMIRTSQVAQVGPMAAVAGAMAESATPGKTTIVAAQPTMPIDLSHAAAEISSGQRRAEAALEAALTAAAAPSNDHTFVRRFDAQARATSRAVDMLRTAGAPTPRLAGLALSIKDLFDVADQPTTAASRSMHDAPLASEDCPAVARLRRAGASLIGHTNMTEFAFSGVGINPHHGTPANPATAALDAEPRIPATGSSMKSTTMF